MTQLCVEWPSHTKLCGAVEEEYWKDTDIVGKIMRRLGIPRGSWKFVANVLRDVLKAVNDDKPFDPNKRYKESWVHRLKILADSPEAGIIYRAVQNRMSSISRGYYCSIGT